MVNVASVPKPLEYYLSLQYPLVVHAAQEGGYVVTFPDLPGCMTQVETLDELPAMAEDARTGWIEVEYEQRHDIPEPSYPEEYSGKFNVRLPKSLHHVLADAAVREGVSLNQYVVMLLSRGDAQARLERQLRQAIFRAHAPSGEFPYHVLGSPWTTQALQTQRVVSRPLERAVAV